MVNKRSILDRAAVVFIVGTLTVVGFRLVHWLLSLLSVPNIP